MSEALDNLIKIGLLKSEPPDQKEFDGLKRSGEARLKDAQNSGLAPESRFDLAYNAAHSLSLAALRWLGYRPDNKRFVVFQALEHTLDCKPAVWRVLDRCHSIRNSAEYEGQTEVDKDFLKEVLQATKIVSDRVSALGPIVKSKR
jgi:hypothetical protein